MRFPFFLGRRHPVQQISTRLCCWGARWRDSPSSITWGDPASSGSKGEGSVSPSPGVTLGGPAKRTRASSLGIPPDRFFQAVIYSPPPPPLKEERGGSF
ncbi:UNVERIFIED_CONTAM: hypothetical protein Slati_1756300 [Sesamum latifolium]|uniref:Uncharacterized protein n=1 Tax=Sesamum latifolium TaxID=2727402 RepID=A0AAW2WW62_9LAMI